MQIASSSRERVDLNRSNLKLPILILFYVYTLVIFIKHEQRLVTTKSYWFATKYSLLSIWCYFLLTRATLSPVEHLFYFTGIYPADMFPPFIFSINSQWLLLDILFFSFDSYCLKIQEVTIHWEFSGFIFIWSLWNIEVQACLTFKANSLLKWTVADDSELNSHCLVLQNLELPDICLRLN